MNPLLLLHHHLQCFASNKDAVVVAVVVEHFADPQRDDAVGLQIPQNDAESLTVGVDAMWMGPGWDGGHNVGPLRRMVGWRDLRNEGPEGLEYFALQFC